MRSLGRSTDQRGQGQGYRSEGVDTGSQRSDVKGRMGECSGMQPEQPLLFLRVKQAFQARGLLSAGKKT